jgi:hypothetical protein
MPIDYDTARTLLDETFAQLEAGLLQGVEVPAPEGSREGFDAVFTSKTQAYREALLGCALARIQDREVEIRVPYMGQGTRPFNGRTLDERVVNPFLFSKHVPCSRGPYLSVFRRSVDFRAATRDGLRDKPGYDAMLKLLEYLESAGEAQALAFLRYLLFRFLNLREAAVVPLARLQRISLEQYDPFITALLQVPSGGRIPVYLVVATFYAIKEYFSVDWEIEYQGINVADAAAGVGGDITIRSKGVVVLAAEVSERPLHLSRVVATFNTKISPNAIEEYLFFVHLPGVDPTAIVQARQYFAQGHDVNFLEIKQWILMCLATMGRKGRDIFNRRLAALVDSAEVPRSIKVAWNDQIAALTHPPRIRNSSPQN